MMKRFSSLADGLAWMRRNAQGDCTFMTYQGPGFHRVFVYLRKSDSVEFSARRDLVDVP